MSLNPPHLVVQKWESITVAWLPCHCYSLFPLLGGVSHPTVNTEALQCSVFYGMKVCPVFSPHLCLPPTDTQLSNYCIYTHAYTLNTIADISALTSGVRRETGSAEGRGLKQVPCSFLWCIPVLWDLVFCTHGARIVKVLDYFCGLWRLSVWFLINCPWHGCSSLQVLSSFFLLGFQLIGHRQS